MSARRIIPHIRNHERQNQPLQPTEDCSTSNITLAEEDALQPSQATDCTQTLKVPPHDDESMAETEILRPRIAGQEGLDTHASFSQQTLVKLSLPFLLSREPDKAQAKKSYLNISMAAFFGGNLLPIRARFNLASRLKEYWCRFNECLKSPKFNDISALTTHLLNHIKNELFRCSSCATFVTYDFNDFTAHTFTTHIREPELQERKQFDNLKDNIKTLIKRLHKTCPSCKKRGYASLNQLREHWLVCNAIAQQIPSAWDNP